MPKSSKSKKKDTVSNQKIFSFVLICLGAVCLIGAGFFILDSLTATEPAGLGKWIFDILVLALGAGASIKGWKDIFKKDKSLPAARIVAMDDAQVATGEQGRNIKQGENSKYFERVDHFHETPIETIKTTYGLFTIPQPVTDFTGREAELAGLKASFTNGAIITGLSGGGGVGKTELARKLAYELADNYPAARMSIDLLGTSENPLAPEEVMQRLLSPLRPNQKLPNDPDQLKGLYQQTISEQKVLILFDNVANAAQIRPLIPQNLSAAIITSRNYFSLTEFGFNPLRLDAFSPEDALVFLRKTVSKLREARDEDLLFLADLCGKLPLALRVATSILSDRTDWGLDNLIIHLQDERFRLKKLKRDNDTDLDVEATISLSYNFLPEDIKVSFLFLGMFSEWFWHHSVSSIWDIQDIEEVDRKIGFLLNRNLIMHSQTLTRTIESEDIFTLNVYALHDLTRLFTKQQLMSDLEKLRLAVECHANYFINLAHQANSKDNEENMHGYFASSVIFSISPDLLLAHRRIFYGNEISLPQQIRDDWLARFSQECINYLEYFPADYRIFILQNMLDEKDISASSNILEKETVDNLPEDEKLYIPKEVFNLWKLGIAYTDSGQYDIAISTLRKSLELMEYKTDIAIQHKNNIFITGRITGFLGNAYLLSDNVDTAMSCYEIQLKIAVESGDLEDESTAYGNIANICAAQKDFANSTKYYRKQLKLSLKYNMHKNTCMGLNGLASLYYELGKVQSALNLFAFSLKISQGIGDFGASGGALGNMGLCENRQGNHAKAISLFQDAINFFQYKGDVASQAGMLANIGTAHKEMGYGEEALNYYKKSLAILKEINHFRVSELEAVIETEEKDREFIIDSISAYRGRKPEAASFFNDATKLSKNTDIAPKYKELGTVIRNILAGINNPDLSRLSKDFANLISQELNK